MAEIRQNVADFLIEIGCEELPAQSLVPLSTALEQNFRSAFAESELNFTTTHIYATPRRLALLVRDLSIQQPAHRVLRYGPSYEHAYQDDHLPTAACVGFARSCGVEVEQLEIVATEKGRRLACTIEQPGLKTKELLPKLAIRAIAQLPMTQSMRWGAHTTQFVRPVHWVIMLFGKEPIVTEILELLSNNVSTGHRFHYPQPIVIGQPADYSDLLYSTGKVIADYKVRNETIKKLIHQQVDQECEVLIEESLLAEVTALVEWPVALRGHFKPEFLAVPKEVLITSMRVHQKCFPVINKQKLLEPTFIVISNIESHDPQMVILGNERVINARLADAAFFYQNDLTHSLDTHLSQLDHVVFQTQLGSLGQKARRIAQLAGDIAHSIHADGEIAKRAALLAKCDLVTEMVGEFPTLQGVMGYYYALNSNESEACALAIKEHYMPRFSGDSVPSTLEGCICALADKLDTLVGIFAIGSLPTADKDPFALRRAAQGIFRILIEKKLSLNLRVLLEQAKQNYQLSFPNTQVIEQAFDFIVSRLKFWYLEQGIGIEVFEAVLTQHPENLLDFDCRVQAIVKFQTWPEAKALAVANKRVSNILRKQVKEKINNKIDENLFEQDEERQLASLLQRNDQIITELYQQGDYIQLLTQLATLKDAIDAFFDKVMIMVEDDNKRHNRLALLVRLRELFTLVADISLL